MTQLLIINPNTSKEVTATIDKLARQELGPSVEVRAVTATFGARYIGSRAGMAIAGHAALEAYASALQEGAKPDAVVLACFGDPGLEALREISSAPVFAFAECGVTAAAKEAGRFAIATMGVAWREMLSELVHRRGLADRFAGVITLGEDGHNASAAERHIREAAGEFGASRVIVGGTGLIPILAEISEALPSLVLDPHRITLRAATAMSGARLMPARQNSSFAGLSQALQRLVG